MKRDESKHCNIWYHLENTLSTEYTTYLAYGILHTCKLAKGNREPIKHDCQFRMSEPHEI